MMENKYVTKAKKLIRGILFIMVGALIGILLIILIIIYVPLCVIWKFADQILKNGRNG